MEHIDTEMYRLDTDRITEQQYSTLQYKSSSEIRYCQQRRPTKISFMIGIIMFKLNRHMNFMNVLYAYIQ